MDVFPSLTTNGKRSEKRNQEPSITSVTHRYQDLSSNIIDLLLGCRTGTFMCLSAPDRNRHVPAMVWPESRHGRSRSRHAESLLNKREDSRPRRRNPTRVAGAE